MAKPLIHIPGRRSKYFAWGEVDVDATSVYEVVDAIQRAVGPSGVFVFLQSMVTPYLQEQMINRFANQGDGAGGSWAPLTEGTERIRHALGYYDDAAINERGGDFLNWLLTTSVSILPGIGAALQQPEETTDPDLIKKLTVAEKGWVQGSTEMIPGAYTPPRPVIGLTTSNAAEIMVMLQLHVMIYASGQLAQMGSTP